MAARYNESDMIRVRIVYDRCWQGYEHHFNNGIVHFHKKGD